MIIVFSSGLHLIRIDGVAVVVSSLPVVVEEEVSAVMDKKRFLSQASAALETNSRTKISLSEYNELMIKSMTRPTSLCEREKNRESTHHF